ncbi:uncharacterized protein LOC119437380 isoform X3 [Dermacentor silvarum]|uniref:uncharacterized protein LOC119437380 isoform X3 n=1 Tax=Dermacentor silvarum TaxID=543639 RepID=UPI00189A53E7|nr:uncharacterized protein LOC119437380 isoform X3 [Dermacentor silvarum]
MAHSGGGGEDATTPGEAQQPSSPVEITQQPRVTFDLATVTRRCSPEQQDTHMDEELQALGLWEEDMTEEQKVELLRVVAASKETAQREEAVRQGHFAPVKHHVPPVSTETRDHITWDRKSPAKGGHATSPQDWWATEGSDDDEWPTPSSAKQSRPSRRQPVALKSTVRRVYSMEHRLNLQWGKTDEKELEDARLSRVSLNAEGPAGPNVLCNGGWTNLPALLESWSSMHAALKQAQSSPGLPLRPWSECREALPSLLSIQDSRPREFGKATQLVIPGPSGLGTSAHGQDECNSGDSTPEIPGYNRHGWSAIRRCRRRRRRSRRQRSLVMRSSVNLREVMMCKRDEKGPDLCSASAMDASSDT